MSTPGRRKALRKLGARKRNNTARIAAGKKPILNDPRTGKPKAVTPDTYRKRTGQSASRAKAKQRQKGK
jgi:hypothetical protein